MVQARFRPGRRSVARLCLLLVLLLVFAQVGAVQHRSEHGTSSQVCSACLAFAPLLAAAGGKAHLPAVARAQAATPCHPVIAPLAGQTPQIAFRSRAPPPFA
ncbi:MAG: hypothetical protein JSR67_05490 [Proteobacteria bacterium]|nr:hypothetical protein [Pseudomonadota bacterium]